MKQAISDPVKQRLIHGVLMLINKDRKRKGENRELIGKLVHVMLALDYYRGGKHMFQDQFLAATEEYYAKYAAEML